MERLVDVLHRVPVPVLESNVMSGPEKIRSRGQWSPAPITANIHRKSRTWWKTQSVVLGGNTRYRSLFVRLVAVFFGLTVGTFACLAEVGFLAYCWY